MDCFSIGPNSSVLELGCGEGRDALHLLRRGFRVTATDISPEAIRYCRQENPQFAAHFRVLDCIDGQLDEKFCFIYAVAVLHMLVEDEDRKGFFRFIRDHLTQQGIALICTMGDGNLERRTDPTAAFDLQDRTHGQTGLTMKLAGTSCRMVNWDTFVQEIKNHDLAIVQQGLTCAEPDFPMMMYSVVKKS